MDDNGVNQDLGPSPAAVHSALRFTEVWATAMGTSFVEYRAFGFWTRDSFLSGWLTVLLDELRKVSDPDAWQASLMEHWQVQIEVDGGCMSAGLDEFLTNSARRDSLISISKAGLKSCESSAKRTGELFVALLEGSLKTTSSSPIDYLGDAP
jgi:hypothetical protein